MENNTKTVCEQLENAGFNYAVAIATEAEINAGAACGQLSLIVENQE
jgi:adenine C2-methylase RlmN of 23S rRNA A2503 and tRNA A37